MQFALMERDGEAERHYVHARHQDVPLGRFLSPDQLGGKPEAPQSWNRYAYALSNPVKFIDPTGEQAVPGQGYVIGQGWTSRSVLDPANRPTPKMAVQFMAVTGAIGLGAAGLSLWEAAGLGGTVIPGLARFFSNPNATERGRQIEEALATRFGGGLPGTFPTIDRFANGVATSVKSLDLAARTYQNVGALTSRLTGFVNDLASFTGKVQGSEVTSKVLELVVPQGANAAQMQAIQKVAEYAKTLGVQVKVLIAQ
jgi:RHS repeat-associated protein